MKLGSLCSGAGGLDLAVEAVFGATTAWHCELNGAAAKVLAHRWPGVPNHGDLINTDWASVEPVDIVCAGWPCQPFSLAGKRKGADDDRALWPYVARAVRMVRPRIVVLENVSAVLGPEFQRVAGDLAALGYDIAWTCLRASAVGAPHRRERVFVVATDAASLPEGCEVGPQVEWPSALRSAGGTGRPDSGHADVAHPRATDGTKGWPEPVGRLGGSDAAERGADAAVKLLPTPTSRDYKDTNSSAAMAAKSKLTGIAHYLPTPAAADGRRGQDFARATRPGSGGDDLVTLAVKAERDSRWGRYAPTITRWEQATRPAPAPTELNTKGNPRLAPAFSEWMMGWPAGWVTQVPGLKRNDQLRIIGNGVVPQQAAVALQHLLAQAVAA